MKTQVINMYIRPTRKNQQRNDIKKDHSVKVLAQKFLLCMGYKGTVLPIVQPPLAT